MPRVLRFLAVGFLTVAAALSGLILWAARSDFNFRGCGDIPRAEWAATVNCADGWFAQWFMAATGLCCLAAAALIWRRGRAA